MAGLMKGMTMPYFRICPHCGAYLDPDEICDCKYDPGTTNTVEGEQ